MAAARHIPAWGVSSLDVLAAAAGGVEVPVRAVMEAGRGRFATALYQDQQCVEAPRLATLDELVALLRQPTFVIGELDPLARQRLLAVPEARLASAAQSMRRAGFLAQLGCKLMQAREVGDARLLDALYVS
jgi:tRNA A37 threonylcarbamoyladenosine modification protein TsaB